MAAGYGTQGDRPLVTIVTVARNAVATIADTLVSVGAQSCRNYEHVVIDGASTDGTAEVIAAHADRLAFWSSEPDRGIADAMNKGLARARGDYVLFLHADDYLADSGALVRAATHLQRGGAVYVFDVLFATAGRQTRRRHSGGMFRLAFKPFCHQGALCRRDLFSRLGAFDERYAICMDYDFFLRAARTGAAIEGVPELLSVVRDTGISSRRDWPNLAARFREEREIHRRNCPNAAMAAVYRLYWALYWPYRWVKGLLAATRQSNS